MDALVGRAKKLEQELASAMQKLRIAELSKTHAQMTAEIAGPDFWRDSQAAQLKMKEHAERESRIQPWLQLQAEVRELLELFALGDASSMEDLGTELDKLEERFATRKKELQLAGPFDDHAVIVTIQAGAGGTDAQDWADMLRRMYVRYGERQSYRVRQIDESVGDEAGIKSATLELDGPMAYGYLKGEHGVHRLVRQSPFNADGLRQTSFARVEVLPKINTPAEVAIDEKDLKIDVYRSGGKGGQSVNTTDSAVRVTHIPTGITVAIQNERSQLQNKETALTILRSKLAQLQLEQHQAELTALRGPNEQAAWGNQIRSYVLHPYKMVKDLRTQFETSDTERVLDGELEGLITAYLEQVTSAA